MNMAIKQSTNRKLEIPDEKPVVSNDDIVPSTSKINHGNGETKILSCLTDSDSVSGHRAVAAEANHLNNRTLLSLER